jgi:hypothetical protein
VIIDAETHERIDVLPDRTAGTLEVSNLVDGCLTETRLTLRSA